MNSMAIRSTVVLLTLFTAAPVAAQSSPELYPNKLIKFVLPYPPGSGIDLVGRVIAKTLQAELRQPVVVENRPGAATLLAADHVAKSPPDGYTVMLGTNSTFAISPLLYANPKVDSLKDLTLISRVGATNFFLVAGPSFQVKSVKELIDAVRKNPGKFNYGSAGSGSAHHLFMEAFKMEVGLHIQHIPYKGGAPAFTDLLSGKIEMMFLDGSLAIPNIKAGKVVGLGTSLAKSSHISSVPPISQTVAGYNYGGWMALGAPGGIPTAVNSRLSAIMTKFYGTQEYRDLIAKAGMEPMEPMSPGEIREFLRKEIAYWGTVIKASGAKVE